MEAQYQNVSKILLQRLSEVYTGVFNGTTDNDRCLTDNSQPSFTIITTNVPVEDFFLPMPL